jgi:glycosyltransferase involved in cell wall biosynthesis
MMDGILHIVEPTLESEAGHCHSFVASFCGERGKSGFALRLYAGRGARLPHLEETGVRVFPYFRRRLRRLQVFLLFRRLLREPGRIFLPTATRIDLALLSLAAGGVLPPRKAYLFFHWFRPDAKKRKFLARMARLQPNAVVLCPTESVVGIFRECGFGHALTVPYPITPVGPDGQREEGFRHLLFAGAARIDKGFPAVVNLVAHLNEQKTTLPVSIQASADHYDRYEPRVRAEIDRLGKIGYPHLTLRFGTLREEEYRELFRGAVCLQPYDPADFADRVSGVTLDALSHGCPVVTRKGTWMGRVVERFDAGKAVDAEAPQELLAAAEEIVREYGRYRKNALHAGGELQRELNASRLFEIVAA